MTARLRDRLRAEAEELFRLELDEAALAKLEGFVDLLVVWSRKMNLVAVESAGEVCDRHVLDSLAASGLLGAARRVADIGSGAGLPGIPLAIALPAARFTLIEARRKRVTFLRQATRTLSLQNVEIVEGRVDEGTSPGVESDAVTLRAVAPASVAAAAARLLDERGSLLVFAKAGAVMPLPGFILRAHFDYVLPGGERHTILRYRLDA